MALSELEIINAALVKLAAAPLVSLLDTGSEAMIALTLYPPVRDAMLAAYLWSFALREQVVAVPEGIAPVAGFSHAYALPTDHLRTIAVTANGATIRYRQYGNRIECNTADGVVITYVARVLPPEYAAYFDMVLVSRLAAELCVPLTENAARAEILYRMAEQEFARARHTDAQQDSPARLTSFPLIDVRG